MHRYELIAFNIPERPDEDDTNILFLLHEQKFTFDEFNELVDGLIPAAIDRRRERWKDAVVSQELHWCLLIYDVQALLIERHGFTTYDCTSCAEYDAYHSFGPLIPAPKFDPSTPHCHKCGTPGTSADETLLIVPPYHDKTSFRCPACITPEEQERVDESRRAHAASIIPWEECESQLGPEQFKRFQKWMYGQTISGNGPYRWDFARFQAGLPVID